MLKSFTWGFRSPFCSTILHRNERGSILIEVLFAIAMLVGMYSLLITSYSSVSPVKYILETSQNFQIRENLKMYNSIAPEIAKTLNIGESVTFNINSPNYAPIHGVKYINMFEDYATTDTEWLREGLSEPLTVYNTLKNMSDITVTRSGINTFSCTVKVRYYNYNDLMQFKTDLDATRVITESGNSYATFSRGIQREYDMVMSGEIIESVIGDN